MVHNSDMAKTAKGAPPTSRRSLYASVLSLLAFAGSAGFLTLSALDVGVVPLYLNRTAEASEWFTPATPRLDWFAVIMGVLAVLAAAWVAQLWAYARLPLVRAAPFFVFWCVSVAAWNATALIPELTGRVVDAVCVAGALVGVGGVYGASRAWRSTRGGLDLLADAFASWGVVVTGFGLGVVGVMVVDIAQSQTAADMHLSDEVQIVLPNVVSGALALMLTIFARDPVAGLAAAACALTQRSVAIAVIACVLHVALVVYACARRSRVCV